MCWEERFGITDYTHIISVIKIYTVSKILISNR